MQEEAAVVLQTERESRRAAEGVSMKYKGTWKDRLMAGVGIVWSVAVPAGFVAYLVAAFGVRAVIDTVIKVGIVCVIFWFIENHR